MTDAPDAGSKKVIEIKARLGTTDYKIDDHEHAHITIDQKICATCDHHMCMFACPALCFELIDGKMVFHYEDCVECGTCDVVCTPGSVRWNHPRGGFGVNYEYG